MSALLALEGVTKLFPIRRGGHARFGRFADRNPAAVHAVDEVSFSIDRGATVGLVGESGCGKSTLARLIARLLDPSRGAILFEGQDIARVPAVRFARTAERAGIQMVFQDATESLNPRFTAFDAIADPVRRLGDVPRGGGVARRVRESAEMVGLSPELLTRFPHQLSGGQKARVGIARAIALHPKLLILDEPTSALDVSVQALILQLLDQLRRQLRITYLFVSHDLNVVRLLCDRVIVMYLGKIVEAGPVEEVFVDPLHPYTQALISAIPTMQTGRRAARIRIEAEPRSPIDPAPTVCRFYGRCPRGTDLCRMEMPAPRAIARDRAVACHFA